MTQSPPPILGLLIVTVALVVATSLVNPGGLEFVLWFAALVAAGLLIAGLVRYLSTVTRGQRKEAATMLRSGGLSVFRGPTVKERFAAPTRTRPFWLAIRSGGLNFFRAERDTPGRTRGSGGEPPAPQAGA